jgi:GAF domain-containing protein
MTDVRQSTERQILERRVRELSTLHEIARAVTSVLDLEAVLNRIVEAAVYLTGAEEGFLMLVDDEAGDLMLRAGKGLGDKASHIMNVKVSDSIAGQVIKTGKPVRMGGIRRDEEYKVKTGYLVKSLLHVPIRWSGRVIGVLAVDHSIASMRTFSDHDVTLLSSLADYAAIAIQNASLFAAAASKADELARALDEQSAKLSEIVSPEEDRRAMEQFAEGFRSRRDEMLRGINGVRDLARGLQSQAGQVTELARRLEMWEKEFANLLPRLEQLAASGLPGAAQLAQGGGRRPGATSALDRELLQHLAEGVLVADGMGIIREANVVAADMLGRPAAELIGSELENVAADARWEHTVNSLQLALMMEGSKQAMAAGSELTLCVVDHVLHARLVPVFDGDAGMATHIVVLLHDVSVETEGWRARDEALAVLSRKLRGPMTAIASYSDLLLGDTAGRSDSVQRRYMERIRRGVDRLEEVLNEFDGDSAAAAWRATPSPCQSTSQVVNQSVDAVQNELSLEGVNISRDVGQDLPAVQLDAEYVSHFVTDLLSAAGRRTRVGDSVDVSTQVQTENGQARHVVVLIQSRSTSDDEIPPLEEAQEVRAVLSMAEEVGARVWLEPREDQGALITLLLPVAEPAFSMGQAYKN